MTDRTEPPPQPDDGDPARRWFDGADRNRDGRLSVAELMIDADRFFAPDIEEAKQMVLKGELSASCKSLFVPLHP